MNKEELLICIVAFLALFPPFFIWRKMHFAVIAVFQSLFAMSFIMFVDWFMYKDPFFLIAGVNAGAIFFVAAIVVGLFIRMIQNLIKK